MQKSCYNMHAKDLPDVYLGDLVRYGSGNHCRCQDNDMEGL